jgi:hypothetical protein
MVSPRDVCGKALAGLEPDILDYIVEMLESQEADAADIKESVVSFLVGAEFSAGEEEAAAVCEGIFAQLGLACLSSAAAETAAGAPTALLDKPKSLVCIHTYTYT